MFAKLLNIELERKGFKTVEQKADACGLKYEVMRQMLKGKHPSDERIVEICNRLNLSSEAKSRLLLAKMQDKAKSKGILESFGVPIINGTSQLVEAALKKNQPIELKEDHKIPVYSTIKAGAGEMGVEGEIVDEISIDDDYRRQKVFAVRVSGNSMEPEIFDGEIAIFKPINGEPRKDRDIFAVEVEGWASWVIKYVREDPSGMIQLISANQTYQVKEIDPKVTRVILRGKLVESRRIRK